MIFPTTTSAGTFKNEKVLNLDNVKNIQISQQTKLIDVLAEEYSINGLLKTVDNRGFQLINGLEARTEKRPSGARSSLGHRGSARKEEEDYTNSLSGVKTMKVQPGVILKEFNEKCAQGRSRANDFVRVSGGSYRDCSPDATAKLMSLKEYSAMRQIHSYE